MIASKRIKKHWPQHRFRDLTGLVFGRLTAIKAIRVNARGCYIWRCQCGCGVIVSVVGAHLSSGTTRSCGCLQRETILKIRRKHGESGYGRTVEYNTWLCMRSRCMIKTNKHYKNYGGRGIIVCKRWNNFKNFLNDMGRRPSEKHSIDRENNDGNYCPSNCRWATNLQQSLNKRNNHIMSLNGKTMTASQWTAELGFKRGVIAGRRYHGWDDHRALTQPLKKRTVK